MAQAARAARDIAALTDRIDVLVNNAGGMAKCQVMTSEGYEENFAGNHLGPFLLTIRLLPLLRRAAAAAPRGSVRIINTSSDASEMIRPRAANPVAEDDAYVDRLWEESEKLIAKAGNPF